MIPRPNIFSKLEGTEAEEKGGRKQRGLSKLSLNMLC